MRIIGGVFKGRKLFLPNDKNTRPLKDLVKESIFNLILHSNKINIDIEKSLVLDLFSGSGSFGLECLSREAKKVFFLENYSEALKVLEKNIKFLKNTNNYEIIKNDCFNFLKSNKSIDLKFDIIFIDPPFKELRINEIIEKIIEKKFLNREGILIVHRHKNDKVELTKKMNIFEERFYGISKISFGN
jgi:16S rRNA (guanine966-N2)-methyltransferase|tara:strand:- start:1580 stop:2140 length:561 start_codon:yes stop_codon:yes gene_type:complete